jgi:serine/threonine protein phosphatase PrpC
VRTVDLTGGAEASGEAEFVLLCSDGVWELLSSQAVVDLACGGASPADAADVATTVARAAWRAWHHQYRGGYVDDITVLAVPLGPVAGNPSGMGQGTSSFEGATRTISPRPPGQVGGAP